ncbi:MAG: carboxypeptidase regulatory-like domain-containing protein [Myxococcales bacterium]|nr:carboxypeptidase regulatory-like domain-containing protein [Myxococcales bacterium]
MRNIIGKVGLILLFVAALACSKKEEGSSAPATPAAAPATAGTPGAAAEPATPATGEETPKPGAETPATTPAPATSPRPATQVLVEFPPLENPSEAGPAYFIVNRTGVVAVQDGKFVALRAPEKNFKELVAGGDGKVYAAGYRAIYRVEGDALVKVPGSTGVDHLVVGADGQIWTTSFQGITHFDGAGWTKEEKSVLGADVSLLEGIALDGNHRPWIVSANAVHVRDGETWKTEDLSGLGKDKFFFDDIVAGPEGAMFAAAGEDLLRWKDGRWERLALADEDEFLGSGAKVAAGPGGRICVAFNLGALGCLLPDGRRVRKDWKEEGAAAMLKGLALDGAGRLWIASEAGLEVVAPGGASTKWAPGTIPEAPGDIEDIVVLGAGPTTLPPVGEQRTGTVHGKITTKAGAPVAGKKMEICASPAAMFQETPCTGAPFVATATTTEQGEFTFENVPIGTYGFAIEIDGKWSVSFMEDCCERMQPGQVYEAGSFEID